jgi:hypothetical protein
LRVAAAGAVVASVEVRFVPDDPFVNLAFVESGCLIGKLGEVVIRVVVGQVESLRDGSGTIRGIGGRPLWGKLEQSTDLDPACQLLLKRVPVQRVPEIREVAGGVGLYLVPGDNYPFPTCTKRPHAFNVFVSLSNAEARIGRFSGRSGAGAADQDNQGKET